MPRCQNTFRRLGDAATVPGAGVGVWTCSFCGANETYSTVRDPALLSYAATAKSVAIHDFGAPVDPAAPTLLLWGLRPECVYEPTLPAYDIYLATVSDPWQARLQIGHETFHRVAGEGRVFHWTHEMLACLFAVRLLRRAGLGEYAAQVAAQYEREAEVCPLSTLLRSNPWSDAAYPPGYYGRAFQTGVALQEAAGYTALCRLARTINDAGMPDFCTWANTLTDAGAAQAVRRQLSDISAARGITNH